MGSYTFAKGYIESEKYAGYFFYIVEMLKKKWFGYPVPEKEVDLNSETGMTFPFWSSRAIT